MTKNGQKNGTITLSSCRSVGRRKEILTPCTKIHTQSQKNYYPRKRGISEQMMLTISFKIWSY